jgi:primosomal replication protein N
LNHFILTAALVARKALRYTPAGVPVIECLLEHSGEVQEAGRNLTDAKTWLNNQKSAVVFK